MPPPWGRVSRLYHLQAAISGRQHELAVYAFDLLDLDGEDLRPSPLAERRRRLERLLRRAKVSCLHLVEAFDDGQALRGGRTA